MKRKFWIIFVIIIWASSVMFSFKQGYRVGYRRALFEVCQEVNRQRGIDADAKCRQLADPTRRD